MSFTMIDELLTIVPPPSQVANAGSRSTWSRIKRSVDLPDTLYSFFRLYGSGFFTVLDVDNRYVDNIQVLNVFETPLLNRHTQLGRAFELSNLHSKLPFQFFPEDKKGLFPIAVTDQAFYLLIDPTNESRVYTTDNHLLFFKGHDLNFVQFLCRSFTQYNDSLNFVSPPEDGSRIGRVRFYLNWNDGLRSQLESEKE